MIYYIGYSTNADIRFKSSSGGIGTAIIKYLLTLPDYDTAMTFVFNKKKCLYEPKLIYSFDDYNNCGSIYQDTDNIVFIKNNLAKIKGGIVVTCMPCQVRAIRHLLDKEKIKNFIISFCCSGQTTVEGTWCYYKFLGIKKECVNNIQYRGNGWPSGIQITLDNGSVIRRANWTYPWTVIHRSLLFRPRRCLGCTFKTVPDADVNLADPWLKEYEGHDEIGNSVVVLNSKESEKIFNDMVHNGLVNCKKVDELTYIRSQKGTIEKKKSVKEHKSYLKIINKLLSSHLYTKTVSCCITLMKIHNTFISCLYKILK